MRIKLLLVSSPALKLNIKHKVKEESLLKVKTGPCKVHTPALKVRKWSKVESSAVSPTRPRVSNDSSAGCWIGTCN